MDEKMARKQWVILNERTSDMSDVNTLFQYSSLTLLEMECYKWCVQPYRKMDYKPIMYINISDLARNVEITKSKITIL